MILILLIPYTLLLPCYSEKINIFHFFGITYRFGLQFTSTKKPQFPEVNSVDLTIHQHKVKRLFIVLSGVKLLK